MNKEYYLKSMTNLNVSEAAGKKMDAVRAAYHEVVHILCDNTIATVPRETALSHLETSLMWAIKAIVLEDNEDGE